MRRLNAELAEHAEKSWHFFSAVSAVSALNVICSQPLPKELPVLWAVLDKMHRDGRIACGAEGGHYVLFATCCSRSVAFADAAALRKSRSGFSRTVKA